MNPRCSTKRFLNEADVIDVDITIAANVKGGQHKDGDEVQISIVDATVAVEIRHWIVVGISLTPPKQCLNEADVIDVDITIAANVAETAPQADVNVTSSTTSRAASSHRHHRHHPPQPATSHHRQLHRRQPRHRQPRRQTNFQ